MAAQVDVLVVGAGPSGLALGVDLARRGVDALVVERADGLSPGSRGKGLQPRTLEVFHDLGVLDAIRAAGGTYPVGMVWRDGRRVGEYRMFDAPEATEGVPFDEPWMVPQWRTQEILLARLRELGGRVAFRREAVGLAQDGDGVTVYFADGTELRARYAVAADGGRSTVRRALGVGMVGEAVDPFPALVADVRITGLDRDNWHFFPGGEGAGGGEVAGGGEGGDRLMAICPLAGTEDFQLVARFPEGTAVDLSPDAVRDLVAARSHLRREDVNEVRWTSDFRPRAALADRFRAGRVLLVGDAAHVHSPAGGQGLNTGVQDVYNLGWKLGAVLRDGAPASLLDTYEEERRPIAAGVLRLSRSVHRGETRRGGATRQLGLGYRTSSLTEETRGNPGPVRAGDRAPDATVNGLRLFDAFRGPHWTLLTADADVARVYGAGVFLIRPDGYVGWAGETPEGLAEYVGRVGAEGAYRTLG
ncbi:FAD-dependent monooxygenase [Streptomyces sp. MRC013]|uniref:FAD-dependent monooxygenase n=1 Tax=Streptomyces sp. MRC013 TaxID=2898276 RepID=UPI002026C8F1|nr:FAD-dependent monooxygenase [Streptomyces sp. MRC013]URM89892.1 FAD-dependent monooxygenase [Streptomyces sp. MRC013]